MKPTKDKSTQVNNSKPEFCLQKNHIISYLFGTPYMLLGGFGFYLGAKEHNLLAAMAGFGMLVFAIIIISIPSSKKILIFEDGLKIKFNTFLMFWVGEQVLFVRWNQINRIEWGSQRLISGYLITFNGKKNPIQNIFLSPLYLNRKKAMLYILGKVKHEIVSNDVIEILRICS